MTVPSTDHKSMNLDLMRRSEERSSGTCGLAVDEGLAWVGFCGRVILTDAFIHRGV